MFSVENEMTLNVDDTESGNFTANLLIEEISWTKVRQMNGARTRRGEGLEIVKMKRQTTSSTMIRANTSRPELDPGHLMHEPDRL